MESRKIVLKETALLALGQAICCATAIGISVLLMPLSRAGLAGILAGSAVAIANFFFLAVTTSLAADKAARQNVKGGQAMIRASCLVRTAAIFLILFSLIRSGLCHPITTVLPLLFTRPILFIAEFFRKSGEKYP